MISRDRRETLRCCHQHKRWVFCSRPLPALFTLHFLLFFSTVLRHPRLRLTGSWKFSFSFYLTLALAWSISCCFSLVSVWICCSWACLSCSSCLRKASSQVFILSTAELKKQNRRLCLWNNVKPSYSRLRLVWRICMWILPHISGLELAELSWFEHCIYVFKHFPDIPHCLIKP